VATNVAETSVTIADVTHVIDVGRLKATRYHAATRMASLKAEWVSSAAAAQRRGRAGRVAPGTCYRLWPEAMALDAQMAPEMLRAPLEELLLNAAMLGVPSPAAFLARALQPPPRASVDAAMRNLLELQALAPASSPAPSSSSSSSSPSSSSSSPGAAWEDLGPNPNRPAAATTPAAAIASGGSCELTPLGFHLASLPLDPRLGKLLLLSCLCGCAERALTVAAALSSAKSVFAAGGPGRDRQEAASDAHRAAFGASRSDLLAAAAAYDGWAAARAAGGSRAERAFCDAHYLSGKALREVEVTRAQLHSQLARAGLMRPAEPPPADAAVAADAPAAAAAASDAIGDADALAARVAAAKAAAALAADDALLRGVICAALYPNLALAERQRAKSGAAYEKLIVGGGGAGGGAGGVGGGGAGGGLETQAWFHPSSVNASPAKPEGGLFVYLEKVETSRLFLRGTTRVPPAALLLFGAAPHELDIERVKTCGRVDLAATGMSALRVRISPEATLLLKLLRRELDSCLMRHASAPADAAIGRASQQVVDAVRALLGRH